MGFRIVVLETFGRVMFQRLQYTYSYVYTFMRGCAVYAFIYNFYMIYTLRIIAGRISTITTARVRRKGFGKNASTYLDLLHLESRLLKKSSFIVHIFILYLIIYCTSQYSFGMNHDFFIMRRSIVIGGHCVTNLI